MKITPTHSVYISTSHTHIPVKLGGGGITHGGENAPPNVELTGRDCGEVGLLAEAGIARRGKCSTPTTRGQGSAVKAEAPGKSAETRSGSGPC